jgi:hypothetical protein
MEPGGERCGVCWAESGCQVQRATLAHFAAVWGAEQVELPALGVSKPIWRYGATEAAIDGWHHAVYATATGLAYNWLARH